MKISAAIEKHAEPSVAELVAIAFQVVAAELVDHDDDNELGTGVVCGRECARDQAEQYQRYEQGDGGVSSRASLQEKDVNRRGTRRSLRFSRHFFSGDLATLCGSRLCAGVHGIAFFS